MFFCGNCKKYANKFLSMRAGHGIILTKTEGKRGE
jgi:hypothetical protein